MIFHNNESEPVTPLPGLTRRTLAQSDNLMLCEFTFEADVYIPVHSHPHEQVGYVVKGRVEMTIDGETTELLAGDSYLAPSNVSHGAHTLEPTIIVDTFCPAREDYR